MSQFPLIRPLALCLLLALLLQCRQGHDLDAPKAKKDTPQNTEVIDLINDNQPEEALAALQAGADPRQTNRFGDTALMWAAAKGYRDIVDLLLSKKVDIHHTGSYGRNALHWAAHGGDSYILQQMLDAGLDPNSNDERLKTPLALAAQRGHLKNCEALLKAGADANLRDMDGESPLIWAIRNEFRELVVLLACATRDLTHTNSEGESAINMILQLDRRPWLVNSEVQSCHPQIESIIEKTYNLRETNLNKQPELDLAAMKIALHQAINKVRRKHNLVPLGEDATLDKVALGHSRDMAAQDFFNHVNPAGKSPSDRAQEIGYNTRKQVSDTEFLEGIGENIFMMSQSAGSSTLYDKQEKLVQRSWHEGDQLVREAVESWMASPGHRENILKPGYRRSGIGLAIGKNHYVYFTQNFF
ncbi:ankyrin repeat domain-containing protein [Acanthopleuribacter pedis]|uniref:Ankyrin repeat domain-containing protein n=1 Tax=Acanthopleuribacter pedis TaxID=442870 RepID=A0A8J7QA21_9BACT|nr:ankyrin repeat domain-containing protein [Acanthopleuribacter pedis]MBO1320562.1 ankyrin repeat domain-containing protein [Acanthopleuribacter pedis]